MDDLTKDTTRLGIEVITAAASDPTGTLMRQAVARIVEAPNPFTQALPYVHDEQTLALANAMHLVYGVGNVTKRTLDKLSECRGGTSHLDLLREIAADLAQE